jgi:hypothetical protein
LGKKFNLESANFKDKSEFLIYMDCYSKNFNNKNRKSIVNILGKNIIDDRFVINDINNKEPNVTFEHKNIEQEENFEFKFYIEPKLIDYFVNKLGTEYVAFNKKYDLKYFDYDIFLRNSFYTNLLFSNKFWISSSILAGKHRTNKDFNNCFEVNGKTEYENCY